MNYFWKTKLTTVWSNYRLKIVCVCVHTHNSKSTQLAEQVGDRRAPPVPPDGPRFLGPHVPTAAGPAPTRAPQAGLQPPSRAMQLFTKLVLALGALATVLITRATIAGVDGLGVFGRMLRNTAYSCAEGDCGTPMFVGQDWGAEVTDAQLIRDVTIIVGTKDFQSPSPIQLCGMIPMIPEGIKILYTYPVPVWQSQEEHEAELRACVTPGTNIEYIPASSFPNPFAAWLQALPKVETKYTMFMHNDVFMLDEPGFFIKEVYGALEQNPQHAAISPQVCVFARVARLPRRRSNSKPADSPGLFVFQIYESEQKDLMTTHLINTNMHLRRKDNGNVYLGHEVDLVKGTNRLPSDFKSYQLNDHLEDHVFIIRSDAARTGLLDPPAAYTLEYADLQVRNAPPPHPTPTSKTAAASAWLPPTAAAGALPSECGCLGPAAAAAARPSPPRRMPACCPPESPADCCSPVGVAAEPAGQEPYPALRADSAGRVPVSCLRLRFGSPACCRRRCLTDVPHMRLGPRRLYEFLPTDVPYFVRRRSEEQARATKNYLERKW